MTSRRKSPRSHICPKHLTIGVSILRRHLIVLNPRYGELNLNQIWVRIRRRARQQHRKADRQLLMLLIEKATARGAEMGRSPSTAGTRIFETRTRP